MKKIPKSKNPFFCYFGNKIQNSFFLKPVQEEEIKETVLKLNSNKSVGLNSLPIKILKSHIDSLAKALAAIINISFKEGKFPTALLLAKVTPVFKKDDPQLGSNYRPISVLSIFSKIYEKCMYTRLYSFLEKHNLLFNKQFGFHSGYSANHAIISLIELINKYLENGNFVCGIFIDLQKVFDTVNHEILLSKLDHYEIRGFTNDWFRSFLCNRNTFHALDIPLK